MKVEKLEEFIPYRKFIENQEIHSLETSHIESISSESQKLLEVLRILGPIEGVAKDGKIRYNFDLDVDILKSITELKLANVIEVKENDKGFSAHIK